MTDISLGFRTKTGRAIAIAVAADGKSPSFVWRGEMSLIDPAIPDTAQPYHAVMDLPWSESQVAVKPLLAAIERVSADALRRVIDELRSHGWRVRAVGVVGSPPRELDRIGNPHIRAHAAEGTLFRRVVELAAKECRLRCRPFSEREIDDAANARLRAKITALGRTAGRPWRADERLAATAAWIALTPSRD